MSEKTVEMVECYCGRNLERAGQGWKHTDGDPWYCYEEDEGLDEESRCTAMPEEGA